MGVTARGVAVFSGVILAAVALIGALVAPDGPWAQDFLIASWLPPLVLFPGAALAAALDGSPPDGVAGRARVLWPAYVGLALYGVVAGGWWLGGNPPLTSVGFTTVAAVAVMTAHATVFILGGGLLAVFPLTRPAGFQIWLGYLLLVVTWFGGAFFS
jgi:hypothetical protein